jgi:hypothetical protein
MATANKIQWRSDLFDNVTSDEELNNALYELSGVLCQKLHVAILEHFFEKGIAVEVMLSGLSQHKNWILKLTINRSAALADVFPLSQWILDDFPSQHSGFTSTFSWKLLFRLSQSLRFQSLPLSDEMVGKVTHYDRLVNSLPYILDIFSGMAFKNDDHDHDHESTLSKAKKNRRKPKSQGREVSTDKSIDAAILRDFSVPIPTNLEEKETAILSIINISKTIFGVSAHSVTTVNEAETETEIL